MFGQFRAGLRKWRDFQANFPAWVQELSTDLGQAGYHFSDGDTLPAGFLEALYEYLLEGGSLSKPAGWDGWAKANISSGNATFEAFRKRVEGWAQTARRDLPAYRAHFRHVRQILHVRLLRDSVALGAFRDLLGDNRKALQAALLARPTDARSKALLARLNKSPEYLDEEYRLAYARIVHDDAYPADLAYLRDVVADHIKEKKLPAFRKLPRPTNRLNKGERAQRQDELLTLLDKTMSADSTAEAQALDTAHIPAEHRDEVKAALGKLRELYPDVKKRKQAVTRRVDVVRRQFCPGFFGDLSLTARRAVKSYVDEVVRARRGRGRGAGRGGGGVRHHRRGVEHAP